MNDTLNHGIKNDTDMLIDETIQTKNDHVPNIYSKCIGCPDVGTLCNGPNMLTLSIEGVREMVKRRKATLDLTIEDLAESSGVPIATVKRFLSPSISSGFSYGTVSAIVKTVIGYGQEDYSFNENPCPATSSEIRQKTAETERQLAEAQAECRRLQEELANCDVKRQNDKKKAEMRENAIKEDEQLKIDHLKGEILTLTEQCADYKATAEKRYRLILARDYIIIGLVIACVILLILSTMYLVWDFTHDGKGIFW